ncbi:MAG: hypothetical protein OYL97_04975 [Candidatus Poribacteria bacterium]|nr:hypothetical protein [Candidatus Poribacteria bacterium]
MQEKEIKWKTRFLLLSIYLCLFISLKGCDTGEKSIPDPPEPLPDLPPVSDRLVARIYFDATLSMQGFVVPDSTHYTRICPSLESVIVSGWRDETVNFFRFGEKVEPIDRSTYLQAGYESFYEEEDIFGKTYIEKVIENEAQFVNTDIGTSSTPEDTAEIDANDTLQEDAEADNTEGQLVVIVTDLFQDDSDITLLINHLKEKYIQKGCEVGLFGLRSQFDGTVYDIGIGEGSSMPYRSNPGDTETFRPFYLLVLGKYADIAHYFDRLQANGFSEAETIIFSRYLVNPLLSFDRALIEKDNLSNDTFVSSEDPGLQQFQIVRTSDPAEISVKMEYVSLPHAMFFDSNTSNPFKPDIIAKHAPMGETQISGEAKKCLTVRSELLENEDSNKLSTEFSLESSSLESAIYLYEVTLYPAIDSYREPKWCSEWDMGTGRDGSKTLNLVKFVRNLSQVTARMHRPKMAQFYCYIKKR